MNQEVIEGEEALVVMKILFGSLERNVSITLSTVDESAQGIYNVCMYVIMRGWIKSACMNYITARYVLQVLYQLPCQKSV